MAKAKQAIYPYHEWEIIEQEFCIENNYRNETIFALSNGYIGMRGNLEEGYTGPKGTGLEGTYINGFYESEIIKYGEVAYGFAEKSQTMLNVTDGKIIKLYIEDEAFDMLTGEVTEYRRTLNLKEGVLTRNLIWHSPKGKQVKIEINRLVSFRRKHLAAISYKVTPLNFDGQIRLVSALNGDVTNLTVENDPRVGSGLQGRVLSVENKRVDDTFGMLKQKTQHTGFTLLCAMENSLETDCPYHLENTVTDCMVSTNYIIHGEKSKTVTLTKYIAYVTSRDLDERQLETTVKDTVFQAKKDGFEKLLEEQKEYMNDFWYRANVTVKGDVALQQGLRFNMFHLLQSVGKDGKTNICAKGLTGEGYEGHYFWDTEMYMLPFFLYHSPDISRKLLEYRYHILDKARQRARQMSHPKGVLYPWRTIDGEECSAYFPAGTAQYHINADIAFAIKRYMEAVQDETFMLEFGAEILFETARLWADLGAFIPAKGNKFCINGVTGPDEYTAIVNNNCYTNLMAKENLQYAYNIALWMKAKHWDSYEKLADKIGLEENELELWKKAAANMYIPYNEELGLYAQDDSFFEKAVWDFDNTPEENYPLLLHYHPLVIYRHQVCKQADLVLALFLLGDRFTKEEKKKNYDYYEKVTTHDSSLSTCIFSIVASEIGYHDKAYEYFMNTARMDLDDYHGNTKHGIHAANMAGTWMSLIHGFAGMRVYDNTLSFHPYLPDAWEEYSFNITFRGAVVKVTVNQQGTAYELLEGAKMVLSHKGEIILLKPNEKQIR